MGIHNRSKAFDQCRVHLLRQPSNCHPGAGREPLAFRVIGGYAEYEFLSFFEPHRMGERATHPIAPFSSRPASLFPPCRE